MLEQVHNLNSLVGLDFFGIALSRRVNAADAVLAAPFHYGKHGTPFALHPHDIVELHRLRFQPINYRLHVAANGI